MIRFLPFRQENFSFSDLYRKLETTLIEKDANQTLNVRDYPFSRIRFFFYRKIWLPDSLRLTKDKIVRFDMFQNIYERGDYFYLIAYHYFITDTNYNFTNKVEGIMTVPVIQQDGRTRKISFFNELYSALSLERKESQNQVRQEYILSKNKFDYINTLVELLFRDFNDLEDASKIEKNHFAKYGIIIREIYIEIFKDFHSNYLDFLSDANFKKLLEITFPSKKEEMSFQFKNRPNFKNGLTPEAKKVVIETILYELIKFEFVSTETSFSQINDLFSNRRREQPKIVWLRNVTELKSLYKTLKDNDFILPTNNKHWKIISDFFIFQNGAEVTYNKLKSNHYSNKLEAIIKLDSSFSILKTIKSAM